MSTAGLASQAASSGASSGSFATGFMNMPPTKFNGFDDGYCRLGAVPYCRPGIGRNRYRPIMTFGNPADFVSGPQNRAQKGQPKKGGGSMATFKDPLSSGSGKA